MNFSYFQSPVKNVVPYKDIDLQQLHKLITGPYLAAVTQQVRQADDYGKAKATLLPYITPAGTFTRRHTDSVVSMSGLLSFDFGHFDVTSAKEELIRFEGVQFVYTSPSGKGLKAIIENPYQCKTYAEEFQRLKVLIKQRTGLEADNTPDLARACFVCHDPEAWIKPKSPLQRMIAKTPAVQLLIDSLDCIS